MPILAARRAAVPGQLAAGCVSAFSEAITLEVTSCDTCGLAASDVAGRATATCAGTGTGVGAGGWVTGWLPGSLGT